MSRLRNLLLCFGTFLIAAVFHSGAQTLPASKFIDMPQYSILVEPGNPPQLNLLRDRQIIFQMPVVAGLASSTSEEHLSNFTYLLEKTGGDSVELTVSAQSTLWTRRRFQWRFYRDHVEFQQFASGHGKLGR